MMSSCTTPETYSCLEYAALATPANAGSIEVADTFILPRRDEKIGEKKLKVDLLWVRDNGQFHFISHRYTMSPLRIE